MAYDDEDTQKAMIVLTDGENLVWGGWDSHNASNYTSYGYLAKNRLGTQNKDVAKGVINDKVATLCETSRATACCSTPSPSSSPTDRSRT